MAVQHGSLAVLKIHDGVSLRDVSSYVTSTGLKRLREMAETTPIGGTTAKTYIGGLRDATIPIEGNYDPTVDGYFSAAYEAAGPLAFEYYPYGTTTSNIKYTGNYLFPTYDVNTGSGEKGTISGELQVTAGVTRGVA